jgi:hypothetical protein
MNKTATKIQSRLTRKNIKVSLGEIKDVLIQTVIDADNPTDAEIDVITQHFVNQGSKPIVYEAMSGSNKSDLDVVEDIQTLNNHITSENDTQLITTTKSELVSSTSQNMGIVLDASEISLIAENINDSSDTLEQDIDAIKAAIMAFVEHKAMASQQKISNMINEVRGVVSEKNQNNSQLLSDGLISINNDIQEANKQFKSNVSKALAAFNISNFKAG